MSEIPEMTFEKVKELIVIDPNQLDKECQFYAETLREIGRRTAVALSVRDAMKEDLKKTDALLAKIIRDEAAKIGKKITEAMVEETVLLDPQHTKAFEAMNAAKLDAELWEVEKESFQEKAAMVREMCALYLSGYFGELIIKGGSKEINQSLYEKNKELLHLKRLEYKKEGE